METKGDWPLVQRTMNPDDLAIREPDQIRQDCARKLRGVQVSTHFQAILGCLLGEDWTTPRLLEIPILPKGHMIRRSEGQPGCSTFLGAEEDLIRNIHGVASVADLDGDELGYLLGKVAEVKRHQWLVLMRPVTHIPASDVQDLGSVPVSLPEVSPVPPIPKALFDAVQSVRS